MNTEVNTDKKSETTVSNQDKRLMAMILIGSIIVITFTTIRFINQRKLYKEVSDILYKISYANFSVDFDDKDECTLHGTGNIYIDGNNNFRIDMNNREINDEYREKYRNRDEKDLENKIDSVQKYKEAISILPSIIDRYADHEDISIKCGVTEDSTIKIYKVYETIRYDDGEDLVCKYSLICDSDGSLKEAKGEHFSRKGTKWEKHYVTNVTDIKNNRK